MSETYLELRFNEKSHQPGRLVLVVLDKSVTCGIRCLPIWLSLSGEGANFRGASKRTNTRSAHVFCISLFQDQRLQAISQAGQRREIPT